MPRPPMPRILFVSGFPASTRAKDLAYECERYGRLVRCDVPASRNPTASPYAFVEYRYERDAEDAYHDMHGAKIDGARITVQWARKPPSAIWRVERSPPRRDRDRDRRRSRSRSPRRDRYYDGESDKRDRSREREGGKEKGKEREKGRDDDRERRRGDDDRAHTPPREGKSAEPSEKKAANGVNGGGAVNGDVRMTTPPFDL